MQLTVSAGGHVHVARQYMHLHMKQHTKTHTLHTELYTPHRSCIGRSDINKHTLLSELKKKRIQETMRNEKVINI